jgi:hypothetical protein
MADNRKYLATDGNLSTLLTGADSVGSMVRDFLTNKAIDSVTIRLDDSREIVIEPSDHVDLAQFINEHFQV